MSKTREFFLTRKKPDGGEVKDLLVVTLPTLPERAALMATHRATFGYGPEGDEPIRDTTGSDNVDRAMVYIACIGLGNPRGLPPEGAQLPRFRDVKRDPILFGELTATRLWDLGYRNAQETADRGREVYEWIREETLGTVEKVKEEQAHFGTAPAHETGSGAP